MESVNAIDTVPVPMKKFENVVPEALRKFVVEPEHGLGVQGAPGSNLTTQ